MAVRFTFGIKYTSQKWQLVDNRKYSTPVGIACHSSFLVVGVNHRWVQKRQMQGSPVNAHRGMTLFAYKYDILIFYIRHDINGLFSLVHEFLPRSYNGYFFIAMVLLYQKEASCQ